MRGASRTASVRWCRTRHVPTSRRSPLCSSPCAWRHMSGICAARDASARSNVPSGKRATGSDSASSNSPSWGTICICWIEADSSEALSRGLKGLCVRLAKALNTVMQRRRGSVFADHYHSRVLGSPAEIVAALNYILTNAEHHYGEEGIDRFSSFSYAPDQRARVLGKPRGWLLSAGWRRAHRIPQRLTCRVQLGATGIAEAESAYGQATMLERGLIRETFFRRSHTLYRTTRWYSPRLQCASTRHSPTP